MGCNKFHRYVRFPVILNGVDPIGSPCVMCGNFPCDCLQINYPTVITIDDIIWGPQDDSVNIEEVKEKHKCTCNMTDLMRYGCKCGGE